MELSYHDYNTDCKLVDREESTANRSHVKTVNFGRSKQNTRHIVSFLRGPTKIHKLHTENAIHNRKKNVEIAGVERNST
jgi:hypothetical protein